jgi:hypothetical protein
MLCNGAWTIRLAARHLWAIRAQRCSVKVRIGLLGFGLLVGVASACSGSDDGGSNVAGGGTTSNGTSGDTTEGHSCSGLSASRKLSELSEKELESACRGYARCDAQELLDDLIPTYCDAMARVLTGLSGETSSYSSDAEVRAVCDQSREQCLAQPDVATKAQDLLDTMLNRPCPTTAAACTATVGELDRCLAYIRVDLRGLVPTSCEEVTLDWVVNGPEAPADAPPECAPMNDRSCTRVAGGVE